MKSKIKLIKTPRNKIVLNPLMKKGGSHDKKHTRGYIKKLALKDSLY